MADPSRRLHAAVLALLVGTPVLGTTPMPHGPLPNEAPCVIVSGSGTHRLRLAWNPDEHERPSAFGPIGNLTQEPDPHRYDKKPRWVYEGQAVAGLLANDGHHAVIIDEGLDREERWQARFLFFKDGALLHERQIAADSPATSSHPDFRVWNFERRYALYERQHLLIVGLQRALYVFDFTTGESIANWAEAPAPLHLCLASDPLPAGTYIHPGLEWEWIVLEEKDAAGVEVRRHQVFSLDSPEKPKNDWLEMPGYSYLPLSVRAAVGVKDAGGGMTVEIVADLGSPYGHPIPASWIEEQFLQFGHAGRELQQCKGFGVWPRDEFVLMDGTGRELWLKPDYGGPRAVWPWYRPDDYTITSDGTETNPSAEPSRAANLAVGAAVGVFAVACAWWLAVRRRKTS